MKIPPHLGVGPPKSRTGLVPLSQGHVLMSECGLWECAKSAWQVRAKSEKHRGTSRGYCKSLGRWGVCGLIGELPARGKTLVFSANRATQECNLTLLRLPANSPTPRGLTVTHVFNQIQKNQGWNPGTLRDFPIFDTFADFGLQRLNFRRHVSR